MKKHILTTITILITAFIFLISAPAAFAVGGDGSGGGSGNGDGANKDIALTLLSSSVEDMSEDVYRDVIIQLDFNKNICNLVVLPNNKECFHLTREDGQVVPITVTVPDDQVQQTYKRVAFVQADELLDENTTYRLAVDNTLMAKNGTYIDNAHTVTFTTGSQTGAEVPETLEELGDFNTQVFQSALAETENSVPKAQDELLDSDNNKGPSTRLISIVAALVLLILLGSTTFIIIRSKKK